MLLPIQLPMHVPKLCEQTTYNNPTFINFNFSSQLNSSYPMLIGLAESKIFYIPSRTLDKTQQMFRSKLGQSYSSRNKRKGERGWYALMQLYSAISFNSCKTCLKQQTLKEQQQNRCTIKILWGSVNNGESQMRVLSEEKDLSSIIGVITGLSEA